MGLRYARLKARTGAVRRTAANKPEPICSGGAPRGAAPSETRVLLQVAPSRRAIPSSFEGDERLVPAKAGKDYGVPGAAKNTGDDACLLFEN